LDQPADIAAPESRQVRFASLLADQVTPAAIVMATA
jgi:hypothetical protein